MRTEFILYFCGVIVRLCVNIKGLVKWLGFIHNYLIFNYKVTKNLPLDQIYSVLISLKINDIDLSYRATPYLIILHIVATMHTL